MRGQPGPGLRASAVPDDPASGQASAFFDALQAEIVPLVDAEYRTDPADRILWGHSFGGVFAVYALLERGGLFHRVIATSPSAFEQGVQLLDPDAWPDPGATVSASLFTSIGSQGPDPSSWTRRIPHP